MKGKEKEKGNVCKNYLSLIQQSDSYFFLAAHQEPTQWWQERKGAQELDHDKELIFTREFHMPESVNQEIELVERLQKRERKKPLARS